MPGDKRFTAYCGLYCKDCIPSDARLFDALGALEAILDDVQFEEYAALKARSDPVFGDYGTFVRVLEAIRSLECKALCTEGGCKADCPIRACIHKKGLPGCWSCDRFAACDLIEPMKSYHPDIEDNLRMIREYGPDDWSARRGRHYRWSW